MALMTRDLREKYSDNTKGELFRISEFCYISCKTSTSLHKKISYQLPGMVVVEDVVALLL